VTGREKRLEALVASFMKEEGIGFERVPRMMRCGCPTCLILLALYQEVAHIVDAPDPGARVN